MRVDPPPKRIWAWTIDTGGFGRIHGEKVWIDYKPKPFFATRWKSTGKWWQFFKGKEENIPQQVKEYLSLDSFPSPEALRKWATEIKNGKWSAEVMVHVLRDLANKIEGIEENGWLG